MITTREKMLIRTGVVGVAKTNIKGGDMIKVLIKSPTTVVCKEIDFFGNPFYDSDSNVLFPLKIKSSKEKGLKKCQH